MSHRHGRGHDFTCHVADGVHMDTHNGAVEVARLHLLRHLLGIDIGPDHIAKPDDVYRLAVRLLLFRWCRAAVDPRLGHVCWCKPGQLQKHIKAGTAVHPCGHGQPDDGHRTCSQDWRAMAQDLHLASVLGAVGLTLLRDVGLLCPAHMVADLLQLRARLRHGKLRVSGDHTVGQHVCQRKSQRIPRRFCRLAGRPRFFRSKRHAGDCIHRPCGMSGAAHRYKQPRHLRRTYGDGHRIWQFLSGRSLLQPPGHWARHFRCAVGHHQHWCSHARHRRGVPHGSHPGHLPRSLESRVQHHDRHLRSGTHRF
mmetsp:Transcript_10627/g.32527  ORF Transcript_10627/g.32527 Transcript_10627/m.32527 type:complete len:309 (+) Transcript_10627:601-1527(+)